MFGEEFNLDKEVEIYRKELKRQQKKVDLDNASFSGSGSSFPRVHTFADYVRWEKQLRQRSQVQQLQIDRLEEALEQIIPEIGLRNLPHVKGLDYKEILNRRDDDGWD